VIQLSNTSNSIESGDSSGTPLWQDSVHLLKVLQCDYQCARLQLEQLNLQIAAREALVGQHIQHALISSRGYNPLRLAKYSIGNSLCLMGSVVLGGISYQDSVRPPLQIEVRCLGRFEARSCFQQVKRWSSLKAKSVLQYLLIKPHEPTSKEKLIEALWPECSPQAARNNLKAAVHSLRLSLGEISLDMENQPVVLFSEGNYRLNPEIRLSIDVAEFEKLRDNGRRLEKEGRMNEAVLEFEKAEILYRGDYLEDEPYEEWTLIRRESLKDNYLMILGKLAGYYLKSGDYENCIYYSQKIIAKDYSREDAYRNLINCYLKLNQRNRALRWYEICCRAIQTELDSTPDRETTELVTNIMSHEINRG
jgi:DNA-binding SARP family transcriptional activator